MDFRPERSVDTLHAHFRLRDYGASADDPSTDVVGFDDDRGTSAPASGSGRYVTVAVSGDLLVDGHEYAADVRTDDGHTTATPAPACFFRYDSTVPTASISTGQTTFHVGQPVVLELDGSDPAPAIGSASGLDHLAFSTSSSAAASDGGIHFGPGIQCS